jgi:hypothetical protein
MTKRRTAPKRFEDMKPVSDREWRNLASRARRWESRAKEAGDSASYGAIRRHEYLYRAGCRSRKLFHDLGIAVDLVASLYRLKRKGD